MNAKQATAIIVGMNIVGWFITANMAGSRADDVAKINTLESQVSSLEHEKYLKQRKLDDCRMRSSMRYSVGSGVSSKAIKNTLAKINKCQALGQCLGRKSKLVIKDHKPKCKVGDKHIKLNDTVTEICEIVTKEQGE